MKKTKKKVIIIGAGPGGLTSGMLLSHRGFDVHIFEKKDKVGGRNAHIKQDGFTFDVGPTFLMMKFLLDEIFQETDRKSEDYLNFTLLSPMYRLVFGKDNIDMYSDENKMKEIIKEFAPNDVMGFDQLMKKEKKRFKMMYPCLQRSYTNVRSLFNRDLLAALKYLELSKSMYDVLQQYFTDERLRIGFTFQSKYLGMSPWSCPAAFMIIPYIEHAFGIYHVEGGLSAISDAMAKVIDENNGSIHLNQGVNKVITENGAANGVELENGETIFADRVIVNADFSYAMNHLFDKKEVRKYSPKKIKKKLFSCSTFMLYLGCNKEFDLPHHTVVFSKDYKKYIKDVADHKKPSKDISFYVRNSSITDKTVAPPGHSNIYILVPVSNRNLSYKWNTHKKEFRETILDKIENQLNIKDFRKYIVSEKIITPDDWEKDYNVFLGATFNLGHNVKQMLYFRPHNKFECVNNCYIVGGGTHPGSGLPTIYESGRITANMISNEFDVEYTSINKHV